jgi:hypothetical protein
MTPGWGMNLRKKKKRQWENLLGWERERKGP